MHHLPRMPSTLPKFHDKNKQTYGVSIQTWSWETWSGNEQVLHQSQKTCLSTRWAQTPVINGVITPTTRAITPGKPIYKAIYRGPVAPFTTARGPPCTIMLPQGFLVAKCFLHPPTPNVESIPNLHAPNIMSLRKGKPTGSLFLEVVFFHNSELLKVAGV